MKKIIISLIVLVAVAAAFFFILQGNKAKNQEEVNIVAQTNAEVAVRVTKAQQEDVSESFAVNGNFLPKTTAEISSEAGGLLIALHVEEGDYVKVGQVIGQVEQELQDINAANAKAALANAQLMLERYEQAHTSGGVTTAQLDQAKLQLSNAKAQYESALLNSKDTQVKSKVNGIVNVKKVELGAVVNPGAAIVEVVDISSLKLRVEVDEVVVSRLAVGQKVNVVPRATAEPLEGTISFIAPASNGALKFPVEITVDNKEAKLKAGMYATAQFNGANSKNVLVVPREAFIGSVSNSQVFVVRNNAAYLTQIKAGENFGDKVEVVEGLKAGDVIVTSGHINLTDEAKVRVLK